VHTCAAQGKILHDIDSYLLNIYIITPFVFFCVVLCTDKESAVSKFLSEFVKEKTLTDKKLGGTSKKLE